MSTKAELRLNLINAKWIPNTIVLKLKEQVLLCHHKVTNITSIINLYKNANIPAGTWRRSDVETTFFQRKNVISTLKQRLKNVSTGILL